MTQPIQPNNAQPDLFARQAEFEHEAKAKALSALRDDVADRKHLIDTTVQYLLQMQRDMNRVHDNLVIVRQQLESHDYDRVAKNTEDANWIMSVMRGRMNRLSKDLVQPLYSERLADKIASITEDSPVQKPASLRLPDYGPDFHKSQCGI
jgi:SMC interacting uncharacterized protein involved in chromosome segregation